MFDFLRPFVSRVAAAGVGVGLGWVATKTGVTVNTPEIAGQLTTFITLAGYAVAHRVIDKKVNPGDAASSHLAVAESQQVDALKRRAL